MKMPRPFIDLIGFILIVLLVSGSPLGEVVQAASIQPRSVLDLHFPSPSLGSLLKSDGTLSLSPEVNNFLDATDWQMIQDAGGTPHFSQLKSAPQLSEATTAIGDENWAKQFMLGTDNILFTVALKAKKVYIGGSFSIVGGQPASSIACWDSDTQTWSNLGGGVDGIVYSIAASGTDVYVGGMFSHAGGKAISNLARWDELTNTWSAVGDSPQGTIWAIAKATNGDIYVGGAFTGFGAINATNIARWDGASWHALGGGVYGAPANLTALVRTIVIDGTNIYVGGLFQSADSDLVVNNIAVWDGQSWSKVGGGTGGSSPDVYSIAINGSNVYVGGDFTQVFGANNIALQVGHIALWDGYAWSSMNGGFDYCVQTITNGPDGLYVGGLFGHLADGVTLVNHIALWNGSTWSPLNGSLNLPGGGVDFTVADIKVNTQMVYVVGSFSKAGGRAANHIAMWNTVFKDWYSLGYGVNGPIYSIAQSGNNIYVGGDFTSANGVLTRSLAIWNSATRLWSAAGSGISGCSGNNCSTTVYALAIDQAAVLVGGNFTQAGTLAINNIASYNSSTALWDGFGNGVNGCNGSGCSSYVRTIVESPTYSIVVGGSFLDASGNLAVNNVASYDGSSWSSFASGLNSTVYALALDSQGHLIAGGSFTAPNYLAKWSGSAWSPLSGGSPNSVVRALTSTGNYLLVGGDFTMVGNNNISYIAFNDSLHSYWGGLGEGLNSPVYSIDLGQSGWYVGGAFTASGLTGINHVAKFANNSWSGLGSGTDGNVYALLVEGNEILVGGEFLNAGGNPSDYFGLWAYRLHEYLPMISH